MLTPEPSDAGTQVTLRASGILRFLPAPFLAAWLCGWAVGEWFALRLLATMLRALLGTDFLASWFPAVGGKLPPGPGLPLFAGFILLWLALWTLGGVGAFQQLLALLFGRERVRWGADALEIERSALWFVSRTRLPATEITGFRLWRSSLLADSRQRASCVASFGSNEDRRQLREMLEGWRATIGPPAPLREEESPVPSFVAFRDETGAIALRAPGTRRPVGVLLGVAGLAFLAGIAGMFAQKQGASLVIGVSIFGIVGTALLAASLWLLAVRESWHMGPGRLERRRAFLGRTWSTEFVPLELQVSGTRDSDGDLRWALTATGAGQQQTLASTLDDPNLPLTLGTWLAERTGARLVRRDLEPLLRRAG